MAHAVAPPTCGGLMRPDLVVVWGGKRVAVSLDAADRFSVNAPHRPMGEAILAWRLLVLQQFQVRAARLPRCGCMLLARAAAAPRAGCPLATLRMRTAHTPMQRTGSPAGQCCCAERAAPDRWVSLGETTCVQVCCIPEHKWQELGSAGARKAYLQAFMQAPAAGSAGDGDVLTSGRRSMSDPQREGASCTADMMLACTCAAQTLLLQHRCVWINTTTEHTRSTSKHSQGACAQECSLCGPCRPERGAQRGIGSGVPRALQGRAGHRGGSPAQPVCRPAADAWPAQVPRAHARGSCRRGCSAARRPGRAAAGWAAAA